MTDCRPQATTRARWIRPWRLWKLLFTVLAVTVFAGFWKFWDGEFGPGGERAQPASAHETSPGLSCGETVAASMCSLDGPVAAAGGDDDEVVEPTSESGRGQGRGRSRPSATLSSPSRPGPWAPSVLESYNAMIVGSELAARGLLGVGPGDDAGTTIDDVLRSIPAHLPAFGYISSGYGWRRSPFTGRRAHHAGIDFAVPWGSPVYATGDGVVIHAGWYRGLGKMVSIDHGHGIITRYGHNSSFRTKVGDAVRRGDIVARAGSTGRSTGSHVHYEVWLNGRTIDPGRFMFDLPDESRQEHLAGGQPSRADAEAAAIVADGEDGGPETEPAGVVAVGGDESAQLTPGELAAMTPAKIFPVNLAILGAFLALVAMLLRSLVSEAHQESSSPRR